MSGGGGWDALQRDALAAMGYTLFRHTAPALADDPLLHALLRACGMDADAVDAGALVRSWGGMDALRSSSAKRTLWPRLRSLRRRKIP